MLNQRRSRFWDNTSNKSKFKDYFGDDWANQVQNGKNTKIIKVLDYLGHVGDGENWVENEEENRRTA